MNLIGYKSSVLGPLPLAYIVNGFKTHVISFVEEISNSLFL